MLLAFVAGPRAELDLVRRQEAAGSRTNREATHHGLNDGRRWMGAAKDCGGAGRRHIPIEKKMLMWKVLNMNSQDYI